MTTRTRSGVARRGQDARKTEQTAIREVLVVGPGEGRVIPGAGGITLEATGEAIMVKASSEQTGGAMGLLEVTTRPGFGPPRHIHHDADELFYILSGEFQFLVGERLTRAEPGTLVFIPRGTIHATKVVGVEPGRALAGFIPGGQERAFEDFARSAAVQGEDGVLGPDQAQAIARKHNSELVGPPL
jgi:mannose-6-phosphate isomerase-like protein (cupin superfamily)